MGMYNEVFHDCPACKAKGKRSSADAQISQVVLGFGGFNLSSLSDLKRQLEDKTITTDDLKSIAEYSASPWFECPENSDHNFKADPAVLLSVSMLADRFGAEEASTDDTVARAEALLREIYPE